MRALFISANTERINLPTMPLGLACVAEAVRQAGHAVTLIDLMAEREPEEKIRRVAEQFKQLLKRCVPQTSRPAQPRPGPLRDNRRVPRRFPWALKFAPFDLGYGSYGEASSFDAYNLLFPHGSLKNFDDLRFYVIPGDGRPLFYAKFPGLDVDFFYPGQRHDFPNRLFSDGAQGLEGIRCLFKGGPLEIFHPVAGYLL